MAKLTFGEQDENNLPPPVGVEQEISPGGTPAKKRGRPPGSTSKATLEKLESSLKEKILDTVLPPITLVSPLAAANIDARADRFAKAAARLAAKSPQARKAIQGFLDGSDIAELVLLPLSCAFCVMVDWGTIAPDSVPSRAFGVKGLYDELYPDETAVQNGGGSGGGFPMPTDVKPRGLMGEM